ncbi:MAG: nucleotidyltransferase family protein, partial [Christensenellales bacterium]
DGERVSNDVDILVNQDEISSVSKALYELGFVQGVYDKDKNEITEFSRTEIVKRRINRGEVAPFVKKSEDAEFPYVEADINFSLGNTPTEGAELLRGMIDSARDYSGKILMRIPDGEMFFLHLIMHQYKESRLMFTVERNKDTDLYKLADIYYMLKADIPDLERMEFLIKKYGIEREAGYVLRQTGEIFSDWRILSFAEKFKGAVPEVIDYENGKTYERTGNERRRLCSFDKKKFLREVNHD